MKRFSCFLFLCVCFAAPPSISAEEMLVDFIIASVNGKPITLSDAARRARVSRPGSLSDASANPAIQNALEQMIFELLLKAEARESRVSSSPAEVERYIDRVAAQNGLDREQFLVALQAEGRDMNDYKKQVEMDILRTKIASSMVRDGITVTEQEIDEYLEENPQLSTSGNKVKLRQIVLARDRVTEEEAKELHETLQEDVDSADEFADAARKHSHGAEAADGGLLGVLTEEELSGDIFDSLYDLDEESMTEIVRTPVGYHIFFLEERYSSEDDDEDEEGNAAYRAEVREQIEQRKLKDKMQSYFTQELFEKYAVDKKI